MDYDRALGLTSAAQLSAGLAGMAIAVSRRHAYHLPFLHGSPERVARDSMILGTAFSPPLVMLAVQGVATVSILRGETERTKPLLGALGALMVAGYLGEQLVRRRLRPSGWDPVESPLLLVGIGSAAAMTSLAFHPEVWL